jgi:FtsP/CotA-like multicopper oxidase with cupredoxin domain
LGAGAGNYSQNRASLHLHGGNTPWISDGTPHQWVVPAGEATAYAKGVSTTNVPDMPDPGANGMTYYYPNEQSNRLMFYHDHVYGITRLNVYAGEAAGYLLTDPVEENLINTGVLPDNGGGVYRYGIPLVVQDKTFQTDAVTLATQDPTWNWTWRLGNLWFPHVYMPNQNPYDASGANGMGRWDYGPWFWPPYTGLTHGPITNPYYPGPNQPPMIPGTPNPTIVPEAFMDTPIVNGTAYPYLEVEQKAYRFRILNACNDRYLSLQLYYPDPSYPASSPGYMKEMKMVPAVPDPATVGPPMIQIGTEGGFLPEPVVVPPLPIGYVYNRRDIVVLNVDTHALLLGPAERADVIVDFSGVPAGSRLILYNDAPAPLPASDPRYDYYTGDPDQTATGGAPTTIAGYGPNTRTVMQFRVLATANPVPANLAGLQAQLPAAFAVTQPTPIVPQSAYNSAYNSVFPDNFAEIQSTSLTFTPINQSAPLTMPLQPKSIQELFEVEYGRMNATLGVEIPLTSATIQTTIPYGYIDPPTEIVLNSDSITPIGSAADGTQIWKITHNGVDTHAIHVHLFNVQLINRVGWDGAVRFPEANEVGWKETVRMNPLEDVIVALRPQKQTLPFNLPNSFRPLSVTAAVGSNMGFTNVDPDGNPANVTNVVMNFGWEYVWHCHLLGHEENDMMRPIIFALRPAAPTQLKATLIAVPLSVKLDWTDNSTNETGFKIQRAVNDALPPVWADIATTAANTITYTDATIAAGVSYFFRVAASNALGNTGLLPGSYPVVFADSMSNVDSVGSPVVTTTAVSSIGITAASSGGTVISDGGNAVTARGVCWSANPNPTTADPKTTDGAGLGAFTSSITGLAPGTLYHVRAYATNAMGTSYGADVSFTTLSALMVTTTAISGITSTGALSGGTVISDGGSAVTARGVCWSLNLNPTTANPKTTDGTGIGAFTSSITGLLYNTTYHVRAYAMNAGGTAYGIDRTFITLTATAAVKNDFNGDGYEDVLWRHNVSGYDAVWFLGNPPASPAADYQGFGLNEMVPSPEEARAVQDMLGLGNPITPRQKFVFSRSENVMDFQFGKKDREIASMEFERADRPRTMRMDGEGAVSAQSTTWLGYKYLLAVPDFNWKIVGTGDFNGDGKVDILWRNGTSGENVLWYMNGVTFVSYEFLLSATDPNWDIAGTGDFNGDGKVDILWRNGTSGENVVWYMNGPTYASYKHLLSVTDPNWKIVGTGDFNRDAKIDILWRHEISGDNAIWYMNGATYVSYEFLLRETDPNWKIVSH